MDQEKIGGFIAACRKEAGYTQAALAEKLGITDRAVSKWENGRNMPDVSIMLELCSLLHINVNELLSGERIMAESYDKQAEENLLEMRRQVEEKNRQLVLRQKKMLDMFLERGAISQAQHDKSLHDLIEKMGMAAEGDADAKQV